MSVYTIDSATRRLLLSALREDLGPVGDITGKGIFTARQTTVAWIESKAEGVVAGTYLIEPLFHLLDKRVKASLKICDGSKVGPGSLICELSGPIRAILAGERTALNFLQHLSGIATRTSVLVQRMRGCRAILLDTRKTTPGLRRLEKLAVLAGGGHNHRFGLHDMVLIKSTHIQAAGSIAVAMKRIRNYLRQRGLNVPVEVEVSSVKQFCEAIAENPDIIMLDNMSLHEMRRCVMIAARKAPRILLEASGGVAENSIASMARTGVHRISAGCITHSAPALDLHLKIVSPSKEISRT